MFKSAYVKAAAIQRVYEKPSIPVWGKPTDDDSLVIEAVEMLDNGSDVAFGHHHVDDQGYFVDKVTVYRQDPRNGALVCGVLLVSPDQRLDEVFFKTSIENVKWATA